MYIYNNKKYNLQIIWVSEDTLPLFIDKKTGEQIIPFMRKSNTDLHYPSLWINEEAVYCHRIVAFSCYLKGYKPDYVVDHISGNVCDYRPCNLQYLSRSKNRTKQDGYEDPEQFKQPKINMKWR